MEVAPVDWSHVSRKYGPKIETILDRIADGDTVTAICSEDGMPPPQEVRRWARLHEDFRAAYYTAHKLSIPALADRMVDVADDDEDDLFTARKGVQKVDNGRVQRSRLQVDARYRALQVKIAAVRAGAFDEKAEHPIVAFIRRYAELSPEERQAIMALEGDALKNAFAALLPGD